MDPLTIGLLLGGTALSAGGGIWGRNDALKGAQARAEARNAVLAANIKKQEEFYGQNKGVWDANIGGYAKPQQDALLQTSQDARGNANTGNMTQVDPNSIQTTQDANASPAVKSEIAKRMLAAFTAATERAKSMGKLGGYGDAWQKNQLGNQAADRDIGVTNSFAEGRKALLGPEQDMAEAAAYRPPSIWGPVMQGAGSIMSGYGGSQMGKGGGATFNPSNASYSIPDPNAWAGLR